MLNASALHASFATETHFTTTPPAPTSETKAFPSFSSILHPHLAQSASISFYKDKIDHNDVASMPVDHKQQWQQLLDQIDRLNQLHDGGFLQLEPTTIQAMITQLEEAYQCALCTQKTFTVDQERTFDALMHFIFLGELPGDRSELLPEVIIEEIQARMADIQREIPTASLSERLAVSSMQRNDVSPVNQVTLITMDEEVAIQRVRPEFIDRAFATFHCLTDTTVCHAGVYAVAGVLVTTFLRQCTAHHVEKSLHQEEHAQGIRTLISSLSLGVPFALNILGFIGDSCEKTATLASHLSRIFMTLFIGGCWIAASHINDDSESNEEMTDAGISLLSTLAAPLCAYSLYSLMRESVQACLSLKSNTSDISIQPVVKAAGVYGVSQILVSYGMSKLGNPSGADSYTAAYSAVWFNDLIRAIINTGGAFTDKMAFSFFTHQAANKKLHLRLDPKIPSAQQIKNATFRKAAGRTALLSATVLSSGIINYLANLSDEQKALVEGFLVGLLYPMYIAIGSGQKSRAKNALSFHLIESLKSVGEEMSANES